LLAKADTGVPAAGAQIGASSARAGHTHPFQASEAMGRADAPADMFFTFLLRPRGLSGTVTSDRTSVLRGSVKGPSGVSSARGARLLTGTVAWRPPTLQPELGEHTVHASLGVVRDAVALLCRSEPVRSIGALTCLQLLGK